MSLTAENFKSGFLVDEELMAGVSELEGTAGSYLAFVLRHTTGESLGSRPFERLADALDSINQIPRSWKFESSSGCGGGSCGKGTGGCGRSCNPGGCSRAVNESD